MHLIDKYRQGRVEEADLSLSPPFIELAAIGHRTPPVPAASARTRLYSSWDLNMSCLKNS